VVIALDAGGVAAATVELGALLEIDHGGGEEGVYLGIFGVDGVAEFVEAEGVDAALAGMSAMEAPLLIGESLDQVGFGGALGLPFDPVFVAEGLVELEVLTGEDDDLAGQAVTDGIEAGALFAGGGAGAGAALSVLAIGEDFEVRC
jgi:hypothetical protein